MRSLDFKLRSKSLTGHSKRKLNIQNKINDLNIEAPILVIMGEKDYSLKFPGMDEYITSGEAKKYVPNLEIKSLPEGCHFVHEQFPDQVNQLILDFLNCNKH